MMFNPGPLENVELNLEFLDGSSKVWKGPRGSVLFYPGKYIRVESSEKIYIWPFSTIVQFKLERAQPSEGEPNE
jgi:hypothetical protein